MNPFPKSPFYVGFAIIVLTFGFVTYSLIAQSLRQKGVSEERAEHWDQWMKENLELDVDQEKEVHQINIRYVKLNEQLRQSELSHRAKLREFKTADEEKTDELKLVLTERQFKIYIEKKKAFRKQLAQDARNLAP